jgi:pyruvate/2-oxoglutarate dehydrogenase complex dihydrolipoamide acyltransferase (E2) component
MSRYYVSLPDLGVDDRPIVASLWLVKLGGRVEAGEPLLEVLAGAATVDLPAPADGLLVETLVAEDEPVRVGQRLAVIESL